MATLFLQFPDARDLGVEVGAVGSGLANYVLSVAGASTLVQVSALVGACPADRDVPAERPVLRIWTEKVACRLART